MSGYKVPDWKKSIGQNDTIFHVTVGEHEFEVPKAEWLLGEQVEMLDNVRETGLTFVLNEIVPPVLGDEDENGDRPVIKPGLGDAFAKVPVKYSTEFLEKWQKSSKLTPGES